MFLGLSFHLMGTRAGGESGQGWEALVLLVDA